MLQNSKKNAKENSEGFGCLGQLKSKISLNHFVINSKIWKKTKFDRAQIHRIQWEASPMDNSKGK